ncbi:hypothetical protein LEMLEM_LOCUS10137 [Lemmus lemmus]
MRDHRPALAGLWRRQRGRKARALWQPLPGGACALQGWSTGAKLQTEAIDFNQGHLCDEEFGAISWSLVVLSVAAQLKTLATPVPESISVHWSNKSEGAAQLMTDPVLFRSFAVALDAMRS